MIRRSADVGGIVNVDKPLGWTSHDVVAHVRRLIGQKRVGHAGTLDPLATGVLLVVVGEATRLADYLQAGHKCYWARLRLGVQTTTDDAEGDIVATRPAADLTRDAVAAALAAFRGRITQVPPAYAAIKQGGTPLYKLARQGRAPEVEARPVEIHGLALTRFEGVTCDVLVWCSPGTYVRALARDVGQALGCGAHLAALRRLSSGAFTVGDAIGIHRLRALAADGRLGDCLHAPDEALAAWPALIVDEQSSRVVRHGGALDAPDGVRANSARIYDAGGRLLALARHDPTGGAWRPFKVMAPAEASGTSVGGAP